MRKSKIISLSLPPQLLREMQRTAKKEGRTKSELFREALRRYLSEQTLRELQHYGATRARKLGADTEEDIQRLIEDYRQEQQK